MSTPSNNVNTNGVYNMFDGLYNLFSGISYKEALENYFPDKETNVLSFKALHYSKPTMPLLGDFKKVGYEILMDSGRDCKTFDETGIEYMLFLTVNQ